ncbi:MAG: CD225/dispanin family protein [Candidatus Azobacteroides sp.]|nr:CD225/dispanin family protein [Candidatus Azobacteroides sp.]
MKEEYYYLDASNRQQGPVNKDVLIQCGITKTTLVWKQGMREWQPAAKFPELTHLLPEGIAGAPIPPVNPTPPPYIPTTSSYQKTGNSMVSKPDNYLVWAILATVICCLPAGIVAIVYSSKVDNMWNMGDYEGARQAAQSAKNWSFASLGLGAAFYISIFFLSFLGALV